MTRLLSQESTAGRMRALTELRSLRMRAGQEVADFCTALEDLGRKANPDCSIEDLTGRNTYQLVGALHRVDSRKAYEEVKQLALSIEQSKVMFGVGRKASDGQSKRRATQYRNCEEMGTAEEDAFSHNGEENVRGKLARAEVRSGRDNYQKESHVDSESHKQMQYIPPRSRLADTENKKCFKCLKYGHIARHCPEQSIRVNQVKKQSDNEKITLSEIIRQARSLGMTARREGKNIGDLVGGRVVKQLSVLGAMIPALIDTGSMVSVIPVNILAKAQDRGIDVDALKLIEVSQLAPVFDASNRRMEFLGAVYIDTELEGGDRGLVPFHISPRKGGEIILGTNALSTLGVVLSVVADNEKSNEQRMDRVEVKSVTVARRLSVSLRRSAVVSVKGQDKISAEPQSSRRSDRRGEENSLCRKQDQKRAVIFPNGAIIDDKKCRRGRNRRESKMKMETIQRKPVRDAEPHHWNVCSCGAASKQLDVVCLRKSHRARHLVAEERVDSEGKRSR
ncbi:zinc knuckle [Ostertagia ostertagi]